MQNLSPHWLIEIIKAQQMTIVETNNKIAEGHKILKKPIDDEIKIAKTRMKYKSFPARNLKKTNSEPSHRLNKNVNEDKNRLPSIQSMDDVRQV